MVKTKYDAFQSGSYIFWEKKIKRNCQVVSYEAIVWIDYKLHFTSSLLMLQYMCVEPSEIILLTVSLQQNHPCQDVLLHLRHCYCKLHRNVGGINMLPSLISSPQRRHGKRLCSPAVFISALISVRLKVLHVQNFSAYGASERWKGI